MYIPSQFEEKRTEVLHRFLREHPFGTLVTLGAGGLDANHLPFEFDPEPGPFGTLRAHVARSNPVWRAFSTDVEALTVFQGAQAYISPSWYPTKKENQRAVPTYNYLVVHMYGGLRVIDDPAWLRALLERMTERYEAGRAEPWKVSDAPADYLEKMLSAIVGIELPITRLIGKWKASQNQPEVNRIGVAQGLRKEGGEQAALMADAVEAHKP